MKPAQTGGNRESMAAGAPALAEVSVPGPSSGPESAPRPIPAPRKKRRWPKRIGLTVLMAAIFVLGIGVGNGTISLHKQRGVAGNLPTRLDYTSVNQVYKSLIDNYDGKLTQSQLLDGLKHGLAESTNDPYTEYFTPKEAKAFNQELNNQFSGIGAELGQDKEGNLQVIAPIAGTPAAKAGLQAGDLIASINGASTSGISIDEAVHKIRGKAGTAVKLQIVRNKTKPLTLAITRDNITVPSVNTKILARAGGGNIGYLQITSFSDDTAALVQKAARQFKDKQVKGIVLDMRNNPGGLLDAAIKVSSLWLPKDKMILQEKRGSEVAQTYYSDGDDILQGIPTVVLVNGGSASASEITAGALHDNDAAYVIGQKSYGKGVVQQLINFGDGGQLKVTVASWYRPNGQNINHRGISPDKSVKEPSDATAGGKNDAQLQAAESYLASH